MYIAELPSDVQKIIKWAIEEKLYHEYLPDWKWIEHDVNEAMKSKVEDILYLFEENI